MNKAKELLSVLGSDKGSVDESVPKEIQMELNGIRGWLNDFEQMVGYGNMKGAKDLVGNLIKNLQRFQKTL